MRLPSLPVQSQQAERIDGRFLLCCDLDIFWWLDQVVVMAHFLIFVGKGGVCIVEKESMFEAAHLLSVFVCRVGRRNGRCRCA